ncbi:Ppx/GppA family phosphatase [Vulgatibacter incomptus]|uniref:Exopolyphosphatase n=1 Tax=Vulgatibacter incomptus TaxID=1391653 RepID=A0A0K1P9Z0_9BACT|nr:Exopolyphosphatase [Vulgatibacter incomptus]
MGPRFATIDVGTNSVLLLVAERAPDGSFRAVDERMEITRLGKGVDRTRVLDPASVDATVEAIRTFAEAARAAGAAKLVVTATSAARDATNGEAFFEKAEAACGVRPEVLSGDLEAALSYASARHDFGSAAGSLAVVDIGGGSTELVYGSGSEVSFRRSFDVGAVRLTERWLRADPPSPSELAALREDLTRTLAAAPPPPADSALVGIAGTVTTLCALHLGLSAYDGRLVHGQRLRAVDVRALADRLGRLPLAERKALPGLPPSAPT